MTFAKARWSISAVSRHSRRPELFHTDLADANSVVIWCERFGVLISLATLEWT